MIYCHHLVKKKEVSVTKVLQTFRLVIRTWLYLQWSLSCWLKSGRNGAATIATVMENKVGEKKTTKRNSDSNKLTKNCLHCSAHVCLCWAILLIGPSACGWKPRENVTNIGTKRSSSRSFFFLYFFAHWAVRLFAKQQRKCHKRINRYARWSAGWKPQMEIALARSASYLVQDHPVR